MHFILQVFLMVLCAFLDRWGGGGFAFLSTKLPPILLRGVKVARRVGIAVVALVVSGWSWEHLLICAAIGGTLSLNLKAIADRDWEEIAIKPVVLALLLHALGLPWIPCLLVPAWWLLGVYLSNFGVFGWKLGWHWVELVRGVLIGNAL